MAKQLKVLVSLAEDWDLISGTHIASHNHPLLQLQRVPYPLLALGPLSAYTLTDKQAKHLYLK